MTPVSEMSEASWAALADPHRRALLELLRQRPHSVGELVEAIAVNQPSASKHLRVLRDAGLVQVATDAQRRIYSINSAPLTDLDAWLAPYRALWVEPLEKLRRHLDATAKAGPRRNRANRANRANRKEAR